MNKKIDIKSALVGLAIGAVVTLAIGAASSPGNIGRYQVAGAGNHGLIIDTTTGQAWRGFFYPNSGNTDAAFFTSKLAEKN